MRQKSTFRFPKWAFIVILVLPVFVPIVLISFQWQKGFPRLASPCLLSAPNIVLLPLFVDAQEPEIANRKNDIENQLTRLLQKDLGYNLRDRQKYEQLSQRNYQGDSTAKEQLLLLAKQEKIDLLIQGQLQRQDEELGVSVEVFFPKTSQLKRLEMTFQDGADNPEWRKDPDQSHHGIMLRKLGNPAKNPGVAAEKQVVILDGGTYYPLGGNPTTDFGAYVIRKMQNAWDEFRDAYGSAPEPKAINVDENGNFLGNIDYPPYN
jgi:hypothetical protein